VKIGPGRYRKADVTAIQMGFAWEMLVEGRKKPFPAGCWLVETDNEPGNAYVLADERFIAIYLNGEPPLPGEVPG
jgi:hypothetical protein